MISFIVFCVVLVGATAKPKREHEIHADLIQAAHEVLESMLYAKEHAHMARSSEQDDESSEQASDEHDHLNWEMYSALDDDIGVTSEYFQSFMVAEMADILLEAPLDDNVLSDEPETVSSRFFCGNCFVKYKVCKEVCFGLVAVSADHAIDFIPCATTCLQRLSACCVARRDWSSKNRGQKASSPGKKKGQFDGIAEVAASIVAQAQGAGLGGSTHKFGQAQGILSGSGGKFGQAQGILSGSGGKFGQAQGILTGSGDKLGQAQGAILTGSDGKFGQAQANIHSGDIGNLKGTGAVFGQANLFGVNIGQVPGLNLQGIPEKIQAIFGGVNKDKITDVHSPTIADIPLASLSALSTDYTADSKPVAAAYPPIQQVGAPSAVTSVFTTTSEYTLPTVHTVTSDYTVTSVHTTTSEYHMTAETSSPVVTPPVYPY